LKPEATGDVASGWERSVACGFSRSIDVTP